MSILMSFIVQNTGVRLFLTQQYNLKLRMSKALFDAMMKTSSFGYGLGHTLNISKLKKMQQAIILHIFQDQTLSQQ